MHLLVDRNKNEDNRNILYIRKVENEVFHSTKRSIFKPLGIMQKEQI
jgi:hypothetical protein